MYVPSQFQEKRFEVLHELIRAHSLGTLVTFGPSGLNANHIPFEIDPGQGEFGTLRAHVARANPFWKEYTEEVEALVVFQGPQCYISPSWYPTKEEDGKAVPTYNYMVVHAYGPLKVVDDTKWVRSQLERLSNRHEAGRSHPWHIDDAPPEYIEKLFQAIIGVEIPISKLIGKWKISQNQPAVNRAGVERGLREEGGDVSLAMAAAVGQR